MMPDRRADLVGRQHAIAREMRELVQAAEDADRGLSADEDTDYERLTSDHDALTRRIGRLDEQDAREAQRDGDGLQPGEAGASDALIAAASGDPPTGAVNATDEYRDAWLDWARGGMGSLDTDARSLLGRGAQQFAALGGTGTGESGGFLVPTGTTAMFVELMDTIGGMREAVAAGSADGIMQTERGEPIPYPIADERSEKGEILRENTAMTEGDPEFQMNTIGSYVFTSKMVRVPVQLMMDNAFDLEGWLMRAFARRIGRRMNEAFTTGGGSVEPEGYLDRAPIGKTGATGQTTTIVYDDLIDLEHSIDAYYRPMARWMPSDKALAVLKKLKDSDGRPLWQPSIRDGEPSMLFGYPYTVNYDMPDPAANAKSLAFGDFGEAYLIREVMGVTTRRLEERYAEFLQTGFFAYARADGMIKNLAASAVYQHSAS